MGAVRVCFSNGSGKEDGELVHIVAIALEIVNREDFGSIDVEKVGTEMS